MQAIKSRVWIECSRSRLAQFEKCESRQHRRDDHFENKHNVEIGHYGQTLCKTKFQLLITPM